MSLGNGDGASGTTPRPRNDHTATPAATTLPERNHGTAGKQARHAALRVALEAHRRGDLGGARLARWLAGDAA